MTFEVHVDHDVPLGFGHVDDHAVAQDAGVVHEHVQVTEGLDGLVDQALRAFPIGDVVAVDDRLAPHRLDVLHRLLCRREVGAPALLVAAEVVDHDLGPFLREEQRVFPAEAAPRAGDDGHPAVQCTHRSFPSSWTAGD
jgi:hypothetical protein